MPDAAPERKRYVQRIMMVAPHFEEYAFLLAHALGEHADILLVLRRDLLDAGYVDRERPAAPRVAIRDNRFATPADFVRLIADFLSFRPDVLHWQEPSGLIKAMMGWATIKLAGRCTRTALTIHDPVPHTGRDARTAARLERFRRYARACAHRLFVHGPRGCQQYLYDYLPPPHYDDRVRLTTHGAILQGKNPGEPDGEFRALMFGRMEAYKGLDVLLCAAAELAGEGRAVALDLVGEGPELGRLEASFHALPRVGIENRFVPSAELINKMRACDCVLLPYLSATQSGVLAAAFANGRFVIASRVGGIPDLVEHGVNGLLVEPGDAASLVCALRAVASNADLRRRLRAGARRTAQARLRWDRIAAQLIADY